MSARAQSPTNGLFLNLGDCARESRLELIGLLLCLKDASLGFEVVETVLLGRTSLDYAAVGLCVRRNTSPTRSNNLELLPQS